MVLERIMESGHHPPFWSQFCGRALLGFTDGFQTTLLPFWRRNPRYRREAAGLMLNRKALVFFPWVSFSVEHRWLQQRASVRAVCFAALGQCLHTEFARESLAQVLLQQVTIVTSRSRGAWMFPLSTGPLLNMPADLLPSAGSQLGALLMSALKHFNLRRSWPN